MRARVTLGGAGSNAYGDWTSDPVVVCGNRRQNAAMVISVRKKSPAPGVVSYRASIQDPAVSSSAVKKSCDMLLQRIRKREKSSNKLQQGTENEFNSSLEHMLTSR